MSLCVSRMWAAHSSLDTQVFQTNTVHRHETHTARQVKLPVRSQGFSFDLKKKKKTTTTSSVYDCTVEDVEI